ncbi:MAG: hypothetical protein J6S96_00275 [Muribaculaceae bacterium]|nr:hypothetical protein [Muribaculaceae bacterium]
MKKVLFTVLCFSALAVAAQKVEVVHQKRVLPTWDQPAYRPVLNAPADKLLFTDEMASSLYLYDYATGEVKLVSEEMGSGVDAFFGNDGKVYYVTQTRDDHNLIYRSGHSYDIVTSKHEMLIEPQHGAIHPMIATKGAGMKSESGIYKAPKKSLAVYTYGSEIAIVRNGAERRYAPVESDAGYLWPSLSPDGEKIAFFAAGKGIVIIDLAGVVLAELGNYEMPSWLNNDYIVAQNATDDGHQFTSSQIVLLKADGTLIKPLTSPSSMTMQPSASAGKIVYNTIDGYLYQMEVNIVEP